MNSFANFALLLMWVNLNVLDFLLDIWRADRILNPYFMLIIMLWRMPSNGCTLIGHMLTSELSDHADLATRHNCFIFIRQVNNMLCQFSVLDSMNVNRLFNSYRGSHYGLSCGTSNWFFYVYNCGLSVCNKLLLTYLINDYCAICFRFLSFITS
jgi:hypothetical protein